MAKENDETRLLLVARKKQFVWIEGLRVLSSCTGMTVILAGGCQHNLPLSQLSLWHEEGLGAERHRESCH